FDRRKPDSFSYDHEFDVGGSNSLEVEGRGFDVRRTLNALWRGKLLIVLFALLFILLAGYAFSTDRPSYTATARVIFDPERLQIMDMEQAVAEQDVNRSGLRNQVEILTSSILLQRVITDLNLIEHPVYTNPYGGVPTFDPMDAAMTALDRLRAVFTGTGTPDTGELVTDPSAVPEDSLIPPNAGSRNPAQEFDFRLGIESRILSNLRLMPIEGSRVIAIEFRSPDRTLSAEVANAIAQSYIVLQSEAKQDDVADLLGMIGRRVDGLKARLAESQTAIEEARLALTRERGMSVEVVKFQLTALTEALANARLHVAEAEGIYNRAKDALDDDRELWTIQDFRESSIIGEFRRSEIALLDELAALNAVAGENQRNLSRTVIASRLEEVRRNMRQEAGYIVAALEFDLQSARKEEGQLESMVRDLEVATITQTTDELSIERLEREALANQTIYESFLGRMNEISEQAELQTSDARLLSNANPPKSADTSRRMRAMIAAAIAGLMFGGCTVLFREFVNNTFRDPYVLQRATEVPLLSAIPQIGRAKSGKHLLAHVMAKPRGVLAEAIRHLRTTVLFDDPANPPKVLMFTSSVPGEGKSSTSLLLGATSQSLGKSAIVVGCDLRQRPYKNLSGKSAASSSGHAQGMFAYLDGACTLQEAIFVEENSGLHILAPTSTEKTNQSPADILASDEFAQMIQELRKRYALVVLDSPPVLAVTDARLLSRMADRIVYLVRWNSTSQNAVQVGLREIKMMNANIAGCAMTLVSQSRASKYTDNEFFYRSEYSSYFR
ncbi:MAG: Wzz/FepE/Etk N-terminal domain-containing protein, partial [Litorimonas sp.]